MKILRARLYEQERERAARRRRPTRAGPDRHRRAVGEDPHLQLPAGPRHRPPHRAHGARPEPRAGRRPERVLGRPRRRRAPPQAGRRGRRVRTLAEVLRLSAGYLEERGSPTPRLDAELLIGHALGLQRIELYTNFDRPLHEPELAACRALLERRGRREPVAYILGRWGFHGLDLRCDERVLVPRPETEVLVERCLALLAGGRSRAVLDVGTGSGAIALAIKAARPDAVVTAADVSRGRARAGAAANAARARPRRSSSSSPTSWAAWPAAASTCRLQPAVRGRGRDRDASSPRWRSSSRGAPSSPARAAPRCSNAWRRMRREALAPGGWLVVECGAGQAAAVRGLLEAAGAAETFVARPTWRGIERVVGRPVGVSDAASARCAAGGLADPAHRHGLRHRLRRLPPRARARASTRASRGRPRPADGRRAAARVSNLLENVLPELIGPRRRALPARAAGPGDARRAQPGPPVRPPVRRDARAGSACACRVLAPASRALADAVRRARAHERQPARRAAARTGSPTCPPSCATCARSRSTAASWPGTPSSVIDVTGPEPVLLRAGAGADAAMARSWDRVGGVDPRRHPVATAEQTFEHLRTAGLTDIDPDVAAPDRPRAGPPARPAGADRLRELHLARRARGGQLGAHQQVRRGLPRAGATTAAASGWTRSSSWPSTAPRRSSAPTTRTCSRTPAAPPTWPPTSPCSSPATRSSGCGSTTAATSRTASRSTSRAAYYDVHSYGVRREDSLIDFDEVERLARQHRPRLIVAGALGLPAGDRRRPRSGRSPTTSARG